MSFTSKRSVSEEEEFKWDYFRKLKDLDGDQVNENDENLRKYITDIDQTQSSLLSDEMNAMERTLHLSRIRDQISENIVSKIEDPKDRMLVTLLYKVCNDIDPTRMQFIRFCVALKNHGILSNLNFLMDPKRIPHATISTFDDKQYEEWTDEWSDDDENESASVSESETDLPLIRLMSFNKMNSSSTSTNLSTSIISRYDRDFEEIECIGYGAFGTVHKVKHKLDSTIYAIKKILYKHHGMNHDDIKKDVIREIKNIALLNHQNIVRYFTAWIENGPITINASGGDKNSNNGNNKSNVMSFFDYDPGSGSGSGSIPFGGSGSKSNEGLSLLLSSDSSHSTIANYWQNQTAYSCLFLQTEYCGKYTLHDFINNSKRVPDRDDNMHIFAQILLGLAHIHSKLLLHRDMKPENVFLINKNSQNGHRQFTVKIGDYGLSKSLTDLHVNVNVNDDLTEFKSFNNDPKGTLLTTCIGTDTYAAPEQLSSLGPDSYPYGTAADIYSLGIILFELIQPAFDTMMERRIAISKLRNNADINVERIDEQKFRKEIDLIVKMTNNKASLRPSAHSLILNEDIQVYWMQNILNNAMPHSPINTFPPSAQKSLEYDAVNCDNNNIEISVVPNNKKKESPTFLVSSPKAPPALNMDIDGNK